ncbi:hypothetical protein B0J13DRAFT_648496 [Dactylonectria estremocensis]|uniref:Uncharacterized protein n=1 Tax=Dactylonectria estremocensis TaxID=1079267 RepID=A0A9P9IJI1_9HYPO|nr:hypothetical protein B0J13DRAFT_648496 [Dactylonectria estremocensis]
MSTRLVMLGPSREEAMPDIVVFCHPEQHPSIKRFVKQRIVTEMCQSSNPGEPSFSVTIIGSAPRLRTGFTQSEVTVVADDQSIHTVEWVPTLCGARINLEGPDGHTRNATFGGIVKVAMEDGSVFCLGMTAGHVFHELHNPGHTEGYELLSCSLASDSDTAVNREEDDDYDDDESEVDFNLFLNGSVSNDPDPSSLTGSQPWIFKNPSMVGRMIEPAVELAGKSAEESKYYDWALFELVRQQDFLMNKLPTGVDAIIQPSSLVPGYTGTRSVYMISGHDVRLGSLSSSPGRIICGPSQGFVNAYAVTIDSASGICDGDSGSWVVDAETLELYGHLVASDIFNSGYVMPVSDVFSDIKQQLGADLNDCRYLL